MSHHKGDQSETRDYVTSVHIFLSIYSNTGSSFFVLVVFQEGSKAARQQGSKVLV